MHQSVLRRVKDAEMGKETLLSKAVETVANFAYRRKSTKDPNEEDLPTTPGEPESWQGDMNPIQVISNGWTALSSNKGSKGNN